MDYAERRKRLRQIRNNSDGQHSESSLRTYYYIWGTSGGARVSMGPYNDEMEAWEMMRRKNIDGDVHGLRTKDLSAATRHFKHTLLEDENVTVADATQKVRHNSDI